MEEDGSRHTGQLLKKELSKEKVVLTGHNWIARGQRQWYTETKTGDTNYHIRRGRLLK